MADDLRELHRLKTVHDTASATKKEAERGFRSFEAKAFERMESEDVESTRVAGTTFSPTETTYGQVQDRREFVAWELDRWRDTLAERVSNCLGFPDNPDLAGDVADAVIEWSLSGPELIEWKEVADVLNALVRQRLDDDEDLPPGIGARPRRYISQRVS